VVEDIEAARAELSERGVETSEIQDFDRARSFRITPRDD
jgi:hypothetical protein